MGTPGSRRPRPAPRLSIKRASLAASARSREAAILLQFGMRLAGLEVSLPRSLQPAARAALLFEQAQALAAARALAAAEQQAASEITRRAAPGQDRAPGRPWRRPRRAVPYRHHLRHPTPPGG